MENEKKKIFNQSLLVKNQIEKGEKIKELDIDGYLEAILDKYESFILGKYSEFDSFREKTQDSLPLKLFESSMLHKDRFERLEILEKLEKKIVEKQKERDKEIEEKRKLLILAIKRII